MTEMNITEIDGLEASEAIAYIKSLFATGKLQPFPGATEYVYDSCGGHLEAYNASTHLADAYGLVHESCEPSDENDYQIDFSHPELASPEWVTP